MSWLTNFIRPKIRPFSARREVSDQLWTKCVKCEQMLLARDLAKNLFVCPHCQYHARFPVIERLRSLFDDDTYQLIQIPSVRNDPLSFRDQKRYSDRLKEARHKTGNQEAIILAEGLVKGMHTVIGCFNFDFIGGSMGMAVGEAIVIGAQTAVQKKCPYILIPSSGGARMQEGVLSLIQMSRTTLAALFVKEAKLPFLTLLTNPTTGGVAASFASLGHVILAEPGAVIGFTGARVIAETLRQSLPEGFQTSEFQKEHGFIDIIVPRKDVKETLGTLLYLLMSKKIP